MEKLWGTLHFSSFISYTGAPAKKFPDLFSFIFLSVLLVYWAQTCPVGTGTKGRLYPMRGDSPPPPPPPPPLVVRSLIPQPKEDGGRSVKVLWDGAYGFFISLRGIEWLINHSWASVERLSHQWVTLTANGRLRLRIYQMENELIRTVKTILMEESNVKHLFYTEEQCNTSKGKTWPRGTSSRLLFAVCCKRDSKSLYYRWSGMKSILGLLAPKSGT